jgi:hypothetical protein
MVCVLRTYMLMFSMEICNMHLTKHRGVLYV